MPEVRKPKLARWAAAWRPASAIALSLGSLMVCAQAHATPQIDALYNAAQTAAKANSNGTNGVRSTIVDLVSKLDQATTDSERVEVMAALSKLGEIRSNELQLVQIHLPVVAQNPLLNMAKNMSMSPRVRKQALQTMRDINARDPSIDKAIALADSDTGVFGTLGEELKDFQRRRDSRGNLSAPVASIDPQREAKARQWLTAQSIAINRTSLDYAAINLQPDVVKALLDAGVNPTTKDNIGMGVLTNAAAAGCVPGGSHTTADPKQLITVAQILVQSGVNINEQDGAGNTPLIQAARSCPASVLTGLMQLGATPNHRNAQGFSALSYVLMTGQLPSANALIDQGARITRKEAEKLFFEWPQEPVLKSTLERAIGGGSSNASNNSPAKTIRK